MSNSMLSPMVATRGKEGATQKAMVIIAIASGYVESKKYWGWTLNFKSLAELKINYLLVERSIYAAQFRDPPE